MIGVRNSVASRFLNKNPNVDISGCLCHLAHIAASHANDTFSNLIGFKIENVEIDSFYWLKTSKRKGKLLEYFEYFRPGISECFEICIYPLTITGKIHGENSK